MIITINNKTYGAHNVIIDDEDYDKIKNNKINIVYNKTKHGYYCYVNLKGNKKAYIHRLITDCPPDLCVDHINGNALDNRKENLRVCTKGENCRNRRDSLEFPASKTNKLGIRGLFKLWDNRDKRWYYKFKLKGYKIKYFSLSRFEEAKEYAKNPERS